MNALKTVTAVALVFKATAYRRLRALSTAAATLLAACLLANTAGMAADIEGSKDHPLIAQRYEGSEIIRYEHHAFDEHALIVKPATQSGGIAKNLGSTQSLEGKVTRITYRAPAERSTLEVYRNYQGALADAGFEILFECKTDACGGRKFTHAVVAKSNYTSMGESYGDFRYLAAKLSRANEGDAYVGLYVAMASVGGGPDFKRVLTQLDVIETAPMEARMVTVDADKMAKAIAESGRVAIYGIYFDFGEAVLKPESKPTLDEIAKLLSAQASLKLVVVGHTDNVGSLDFNLTLSKQRAKAVEQALIGDYGIAPARLESWGIGYLSPVASNQSEEGRALNRRVELVER